MKIAPLLAVEVSSAKMILRSLEQLATGARALMEIRFSVTRERPAPLRGDVWAMAVAVVGYCCWLVLLGLGDMVFLCSFFLV